MPQRRRFPFERPGAAALGLLLCAAGCTEDPAEPGGTGPVRVEVVAAATAFVPCGQEVPVTATVTSDRGRGIPNFHLNFNVLSGGGSMFGGSEVTNSKGIARDIWMIGSGANLPNTLAVRAVDPTTGLGTTYFTQTVTTLSRIAFVRASEIMSIRPDGSDEIRHTENTNPDFNPSWSPDGSRIAFVRNWEIWVMNADGTGQAKLLAKIGSLDSDPAWSPDGERIAFLRADAADAYDIWVVAADGTNATRLTNLGTASEPAWSPDGRRLSFRSTHEGNDDIYVMDADGNNPTRITSWPGYDQNATWSPDGSRIAFMRHVVSEYEIMVVNADGSLVQQLTNNIVYDGEPTWSPDGKQIAFVSNRDGGADIYVMNPDGSSPERVTFDGATSSRIEWSRCTPF